MSIVTPNEVLTICVALANLGALVFLFKRSLERIDKHSDLLPEIKVSIDRSKETDACHALQIKELFDSRNDLKDRVLVLETEHRRCSAIVDSLNSKTSQTEKG